MLSPIPRRVKSSSIGSLDSGYASQEERLRGGTIYVHPSTLLCIDAQADDADRKVIGLGLSNLTVDDRKQPRLITDLVQPLTTNLSVFTITDTPNTPKDIYLPEVPTGSDKCLTCEFWRVVSPGQNVKCDECRLPTIAGPSPLDEGMEWKNPFGGRGLQGEAGSSSASMSVRDKNNRCSTCAMNLVINPAGYTPCATCAADYLHSPISPATPISPNSLSSPSEKVRRSRAGRNTKLPLSALRTLQAWLDAHQDNPYPTAEVKKQLAQESGLTEKQVTTWFTNARARQLNPLDKYLSPGSEEGAETQDIANAAQSLAYSGTSDFASTSGGAAQQGHRGAGSVSSAGQSRSHPQPSRRGRKKNYRHYKHKPQPALASPIDTPHLTSPILGESQENWQCTFCYRALAPKSWRRHEETQHRPRSQWTCMLDGPRIKSPGQRTAHKNGSSSSSCAFCMIDNPSEDHFLRHHRISACDKRPLSERTFLRPDHLRQHVKNFHNATLFDVVQARWKRGAEADDADGWTCGFCGEALATWHVRESHIAGHFKEGKTMAEWRDRSAKQVSKKHETQEPKGEKGKAKETGLQRLTRSLTRRSTRSSVQATQAALVQTSYAFSNHFEPIPSTSMMPTEQSYPAFSTAPVLPELDTFMGDFSFDWSTQPLTQPSTAQAQTQGFQGQAQAQAQNPSFQGQVQAQGPMPFIQQHHHQQPPFPTTCQPPQPQPHLVLNQAHLQQQQQYHHPHPSPQTPGPQHLNQTFPNQPFTFDPRLSTSADFDALVSQGYEFGNPVEYHGPWPQG